MNNHAGQQNKASRATHPILPAPEPTPRRKILVMIGAMDVGGCEHDLLRILPQIDRGRFDLAVMTYLYRGALADRLEAAGIRVIAPQKPHQRPQFAPYRWRVLRLTRYKAILASLMWLGIVAAWLWRMRRVIRAEKPDIIHCFLPTTYHLALPAHLLTPGRARRKFLMGRVSLGFYFHGHPITQWWETKFCHQFIDAASGNSRAVLAELVREGLAPARLHLLYNGIEITRFARPATAQPVAAAGAILSLSAVGNLHPYKGYDDLLAAMLRLGDHGFLNWQLKVAGRDVGGNLARYRAWCEAHNLAEKIQFLGAMEDVRPLLWHSQLHLHVSHTESFPNSVLEAMTAGLPVIASAVGGIPEIFELGAAGILVPPHDPAAIAAAIRQLAHDPILRGNMGAAGASLARENFALDRTVKSFENLYQTL
ncbi:MAG: glycosyltransferase [Candidatus Symbiobacter sp.]|nr:glycosyltransferase [Candidatus Symbiobacter sp.]